jgi:hypothetical protein
VNSCLSVFHGIVNLIRGHGSKEWWSDCETRILGVASDGREVCLSCLLKSLAVLCENTSLQGGDECDLVANKTLLSSNSIAAKESPLNFI